MMLNHRTKNAVAIFLAAGVMSLMFGAFIYKVALAQSHDIIASYTPVYLQEAEQSLIYGENDRLQRLLEKSATTALLHNIFIIDAQNKIHLAANPTLIGSEFSKQRKINRYTVLPISPGLLEYSLVLQPNDSIPSTLAKIAAFLFFCGAVCITAIGVWALRWSKSTANLSSIKIQAAIRSIFGDKGGDIIINNVTDEDLTDYALAVGRDILNSGYVSMISTDDDMKVTSVSRQAAKDIGKPVESILGRSLPTLYAMDDAKMVVSTMNKAKLTKHQIEMAVHRMSKDGTHNWTQEFVTYHPRGETGIYFIFSYDISNEIEASERAESAAKVDHLTQLTRRAEAVAQIEYLCQEAHDDTNMEPWLIQFDLDQFNQIVSVGGDAAGDAALKHVADEIQGMSTDDMDVARLGDDEFAIIIWNASRSEAEAFANRIQQALRYGAFEYGEHKFDTKCTMALVSLKDIKQPSKGLRFVDEVMGRAAAAVFLGKERGRDQLVIYDPSDDIVTKRKEVQLAALSVSAALEKNAIQLYRREALIADITRDDIPGTLVDLAPGLDFKDGRVMFPRDYLYAAERHMQAKALDKWMLPVAFEHISKRPEMTYLLRISGQSLMRDDLFETIIHSTDRFPNVLARNIVFMMSDSALTDYQGAVSRLIDQLEDYYDLDESFQFGIDNFGSQNTNIALFTTFRPAYIRVSKPFNLTGGLEDPSVMALLTGISSMGHQLGAKVIFEDMPGTTAENTRTCAVDYVFTESHSVYETPSN